MDKTMLKNIMIMKVMLYMIRRQEGKSAGYEGELQLSQVIFWASVECQKSPGAITLFQFDLQKTFFRQLNFTRSESGDIFVTLKKLHQGHQCNV